VPPTTVGDESTHPDGSVNAHSCSPVAASAAYSVSSADPTYTVPSLTVGEDVTLLAGSVNSHAISPLAAFRAYRVLSLLPM